MSAERVFLASRDIVLNADAVWLIVNGNMMIGQRELGSIRALADTGMLGKTVITANIKCCSQEDTIDKVLPTNKAALENAGFPVVILPYNAWLAFLAAQGDLLLNGPELFSERDKACMRIDAKVKEGDPSPAEMWAQQVRRAGCATGIESLADIVGLDAASVATVRCAGMLDSILDHINNAIIP